MSAGQIWLLPWADTRPLAGETACQWTVGSTTYTGTWKAGIYSSWPYAASPYGVDGTAPNYQYERYSTSQYEGVIQHPISADNKNIISNDYLVNQGLHNTTTTYGAATVTVSAWECLAPKRPMANDPICVDLEDGGVVATLGGVTYRNTHSQRRQWVLELLLDGPLDAAAASTTYPDVRRYWQRFLRRAELGVTAVLDLSTWSNYLTTPNVLGGIGYGKPYYGCPVVITGAITDCTQTRWAGTAGDKLARMKVTMTIAEVIPPGAL